MFDWLADFISRSGYVGLFLLMLAENVFPPIPSELIMPLAGFMAAQGKLNILLVIMAGTAGSIAGALFWYTIGHWISPLRLRRFAKMHGRWLTLAPGDIDRASSWFRRHGTKAVFLGRLVPTVRSLISAPAGIARMPLIRFVVWSGFGTFLWTALLVSAGYVFQQDYQRAAGYLSPVSNLVIGFIIIYYLYRVFAVHR